MLKIALLAPTTLPSRRANTIQVMKMAQGIYAAGHGVCVIAPRAPAAGWTEPTWAELAAHYGLREVIDVTWVPVTPRLRSYDFGFPALRQAQAWGAQVIFTRHPQAAAIASLYGLPTVLEIHDFPQGMAGPLLFRAFLRGNGARRLVSISQALLDDLTRRFTIPAGLSTLVAPDGVDAERYAGLPGAAESRSALGLPERFTAGYTGHMYAGRGVDHILKIAAALPEVTFLLVGGNPVDVERCRAKAAGLTNVVITGFVPNADLPLYQAACDTLLMPYQRKIAASSGGDIAAYLSPMKLFEYMACGRAILSSDLPVLREILNEGSAVLLPPDDVAAWVRALQDLRSRPAQAEALSRTARQDVQVHTWQARAERIFDGLR